MIHFDLPKQKSSIIKVIGVGGGGSNAVNFMFSQDVEGVDFIVCNTDAKALEQSRVPNKIQLGPYLTQGLGAGANPEVGKKATEESLEEIKKILEVNTKMAFITVGMGGGTGTGGAPIIAQVCKDLGILTVGIVTTPFGFEGPRRLAMAEEGINQLKPHVDTLLVISNDKLRMQFGNLKMREAFGKADNVLATAAKCITDIINSRGHIIVDFADVCTVMRNGGVAILGKAEAEGEDRAQVAIEAALTSPLLNDNEIKGAKWILININCSEGDHEATMDEIETINNYLSMQAGEHTDVIVGMGYDNSLDKKIGITLIATGFDARNPFAKEEAEKKPIHQAEKIMMTLNVGENGKLGTDATPLPTNSHSFQQPTSSIPDELAPRMNGGYQQNVQSPFLSGDGVSLPNIQSNTSNFVDDKPLIFELSTDISDKSAPAEMKKPEARQAVDETLNFVFNDNTQPKPTSIYSAPPSAFPPVNNINTPASSYMKNSFDAAKSGIPVQPINVNDAANFTPTPPPPPPPAPPTYPTDATPAGGMMNTDVSWEAMEHRKKVQERIQSLRNLSFNPASTDANDYNAVPAYIRKKINLIDNDYKPNAAEDYYSKLHVNKEENSNRGELSTINQFLGGKKPD